MKFRGNKFVVGFIAGSLIFGGSAFAIGVSNTPDTGYLFCVNSKTKAVTFPGTLKCPSGTRPVELGARGLEGPAGERGAPGPAGPAGQSGSGLKVYDSNGKVVGDLTFGSSYGEWGVLINGLPIVYNPTTGQVRDNGTSGYSTNPNCTGNIYYGPLNSEGFSAVRFSKTDPWFITSFTAEGKRSGKVLLVAPSGPNDRIRASQMWSRDDIGGGESRCTQYFEGADPDSPPREATYFRMEVVGEVFDVPGPLSIR